MTSKSEALLRLSHDEDAKWDRCEENSAKNRGTKIVKIDKETGKPIKAASKAGMKRSPKKERGMNEYYLNLNYNDASDAGVL